MKEEFDVVVVGSGPGGYVAAIRAAQLGLKTACIEKEKTLGGTCLNVGCIPSKALLHTSEFYWKMQKQGKELGVVAEGVRADFTRMMTRKEQIVAQFNQGIEALFKKNRVTHVQGKATFEDPHTLSVDQKRVSARSIILATGSRPTELSFMPFDEESILSSTGALRLASPPRSLIVVGAGVIGVELGSVYSRLGTKVHFVEFMDRICPTLDEELSRALEKSLKAQGMHFELSTKVIGVKKGDKEIAIELEGKPALFAEKVLVAVGRRPYTEGLGLEKIALPLTPQGFIQIDAQFRTQHPHIYALGDSVEGPMLAHKASEEGIVVAELIAGQKSSINYLSIPQVVYTAPEVASVGLTQQEASARGFAVKTGKMGFAANSRAKCMGEEEGFVKLVAEENSGILLGVHILSAHASELIAEGALAIEKKLTISDILRTPHAHPTLSESLKEAALAWEGRAIHK